MTAKAIPFDWVYRAKQPEGNGPFPVILLLHGWTGDENSMWVFTPRLPENRLLIAPRGLYPASQWGYAWHPALNTWPSLQHFDETVNALLEFLTPTRFPAADFSELHLVGFSQGAALAYAFTLSHPERIASLAVLSGFLPEAVVIEPSSSRLSGLPVFITHGSKDILVPVDRARQAAELFDLVGAKVTYCEHDVGHKLNASCFRGLEIFYRELGA